jgi:hypothetical protein
VSRTRLEATSLCALYGAPQRARRDRLRKHRLAVDDDHREVDAIEALELVVTVDRDPPQAEAEPRGLALEQLERAGAETAAGPLEEHDLDSAHGRQPATVKPSWRSLVTSSLETASITSR